MFFSMQTSVSRVLTHELKIIEHLEAQKHEAVDTRWFLRDLSYNTRVQNSWNDKFKDAHDIIDLSASRHHSSIQVELCKVFALHMGKHVSCHLKTSARQHDYFEPQASTLLL